MTPVQTAEQAGSLRGQIASGPVTLAELRKSTDMRLRGAQVECFLQAQIGRKVCCRCQLTLCPCPVDVCQRCRCVQGVEYLIKWSGYLATEATWCTRNWLATLPEFGQMEASWTSGKLPHDFAEVGID